MTLPNVQIQGTRDPPEGQNRGGSPVKGQPEELMASRSWPLPRVISEENCKSSDAGMTVWTPGTAARVPPVQTGSPVTQEAPVIKSDDGKAFRWTDWDCFWLELGLLLVEEANPLTKIH